MAEIVQADALEWLDVATEDSVDVILGSPPYAEKGERYGFDEKLDTPDWSRWLLHVTETARYVARHWCVWVVNSAYRQGYLPACELFIAECYQDGIDGMERPLIWHKNAPPNRKNWFSNNWEYILAFRCGDGKTEHFDWESIAEPPKYTNGGDFRQRDSKGKRRKGGTYPKGKLVRPKDVIRATVGGGHMGSKLASQNEAPYPEKLIEPLIKCLCPEGGTVLDPFCGSGTTLAVAERLGRKAIGLDVRESQVELSHERMKENAKHG